LSKAYFLADVGGTNARTPASKPAETKGKTK